MTTAVRVSENLVREARLLSVVDNRSVTGQIEHWAHIGRCAEENPDLTYRLIKDVLIGIEELNQGESTEYRFGWGIMRIIQSRTFEKRVRQFAKQEKKVLDQLIRKIAENTAIGQEKRGELRGVFVYKFKIHATQHLLSYRMADAETLELIMIGPHENYYRDLTTYLKTRR
jgi:mRNA interferase RelE/StbE